MNALEKAAKADGFARYAADSTTNQDPALPAASPLVAPAASAPVIASAAAIDALPLAETYPTVIADLKARGATIEQATHAILEAHAAATTGKGNTSAPAAEVSPTETYAMADKLKAHIRAAAAEGRHISVATASAELYPVAAAGASSTAGPDPFYAKQNAAHQAAADRQAEGAQLGARAKLYMVEAAARGRNITSAQAIAELETLDGK